MANMSMRLPSGQEIQAPDWLDAEPLYSAVEIDDGAINTLSAFTYGIGQVVPGSNSRLATKIDTNLEGNGGRLPWTEEMLVYAVCVEFFLDGEEAANNIGGPAQEPDVSLSNILALQQSLMLSWRSTYTHELFRAPVGYFPAASGVHSVRSEYIADGGDDSPVVANNGGICPSAMRELSTPIYVPADDTFAVDLTPAGGSVGSLLLSGSSSRIYTRIFLEGYRRKPR